MFPVMLVTVAVGTRYSRKHGYDKYNWDLSRANRASNEVKLEVVLCFSYCLNYRSIQRGKMLYEGPS